MNWFTRHINWTYIFSLIIATSLFYAIFAAINSSGANEDNLYGLKIYIDNAYTKEWGGSNLPNLEQLTWGSDYENGESWESTTLTAYLENTGPYDLKVDTSAYKDLSSVAPGWGVSSNTINLKSEEHSPLEIKLSHSIWIDVYNPMIYFKVETLGTGATPYWIWILYSIWIVALVSAAAWLLYQKKRSYAWILLCLGVIGIIILLCLENKRRVLEVIKEVGG